MRDLSKKNPEDQKEGVTRGEVMKAILDALKNVGAGSSVMVGNGPPQGSLPGVGIYIDVDTGNIYRQD